MRDLLELVYNFFGNRAEEEVDGGNLDQKLREKLNAIETMYEERMREYPGDKKTSKIQKQNNGNNGRENKSHRKVEKTKKLEEIERT